jgi:glycosyltransferase involved in cell wall biosynthesis
MRVLYFSRSYTTHDYRFLKGLSEAGYEVYFLCLEKKAAHVDSRSLPARVQGVDAGFPEETPQLDGLLSVAPSLQRILEEIRPNVVHAGPVQSCAFAIALTGFRPLITMSWGSDLLVQADADELSRWATSYTLCRSDFLVTDSSEVSERALAFAPLRSDAIIQFPWGIDLNVFTPDRPRNSAGLDRESTFIVVSNRAWEPGYGVLTVIEGFQRARIENPGLRLLLIGDGSLKPQVQALLSEHGLSPFVCTPGYVPNEAMPEYLRSADAYISCSHSDGSSVSLMEAIATGLPVIVTDRPSNREWVIPEENGWLVPAGDTSGVCDALLRAARQDSEALSRMRSRNRAVAEAHANWQRNLDKLLRVYGQIGSQQLAISPL